MIIISNIEITNELAQPVSLEAVEDPRILAKLSMPQNPKRSSSRSRSSSQRSTGSEMPNYSSSAVDILSTRYQGVWSKRSNEPPNAAPLHTTTCQECQDNMDDPYQKMVSKLIRDVMIWTPPTVNPYFMSPDTLSCLDRIYQHPSHIWKWNANYQEWTYAWGTSIIFNRIIFEFVNGEWNVYKRAAEVQ